MTRPIAAPTTPRAAFNPDRPLNAIQRSQLEQFHAVFDLGPLSRTELGLTEGQAAVRIGRYTARLTQR